MDFKQMASSLGVDIQDFVELVDLLVTTSLSDLELLETALDGNDPVRVAGAAHSIKGAAGNMGFMELSGKAATIEAEARKGALEGVRSVAAAMGEDLLALKNALGHGPEQRG